MYCFGSLPVFSLASFSSSSVMARLAGAMSTLPLIKAAMPTPDPPPRTWAEMSGWFF